MSQTIFRTGFDGEMAALSLRDRPLSLRDALVPLFRNRRLVTGVFFGVFLCFLLLAWFWASRYYVAKMQVVVAQGRSDPTVSAAQNAAVQTSKAPSPDIVSSEVVLLQGQDMLRSVAQTCGLADRSSVWDIFLPKDAAQRRAAKLEKAALSTSKALKVEVEKASDVINVRFGAIGSPQTPACVLQNLGKLYLEKHLQLRRPAGASVFFAEQTDRYAHELANVEKRLASFGHDQGVAAPDVLRPYVAQQLAAAVAALHSAEQAIAADQSRMEQLEKQLQSTPERIVTQQTANAANSLLQQLEASLLVAQVKRTQLLVKFDSSYPLVRETDDEIAQTQAAIAKAKEMNYTNQTTDRDPTREYVRQDMARTQADLASQKANAVTITNSITATRQQMAEIDAKAVEQGALVREQKANEANYLLYMSKREQERMSDALDARNIGDVAIAVPAAVPVLPAVSPFNVIFLGFIFAVFAGASAGFIAERIDSSFRTPQEVMEILSIPVLASLPRQVTN